MSAEIERKKAEVKRMRKLIDSHWEYVEGIMAYRNMEWGEIKKIEYHYKTAMEHGWKHAKEDKV